MNKENTAFKNGKIMCGAHGELSGADCVCLQEKSTCKNCFIYEGIKKVSAELKKTKKK